MSSLWTSVWPLTKLFESTIPQTKEKAKRNVGDASPCEVCGPHGAPMAGTRLVAHSEDSMAAGLAEHSERVEPPCRHQARKIQPCIWEGVV